MKKLVLIFLTFILFLNTISAKGLQINSKYAYVYNLNEKRVMYEKNAYDEIKVASLTKIMTAIIVVEKNKDLDKKIDIIDQDLRDMYVYTTAGFKAGDTVTIRDLLYGILLRSGSDAVNAAVRITAGSEEKFVSLMNQKVKELNLTHTYFSNPIGKDEGNYSSMHDIAKILEYAIKNSSFKKIISTRTYLVKSLNIELNGPLTNSIQKYNIDTSMVTGVKNGYTTESKHSLCSFMEKDNLTYIAATSYAESSKESVIDTTNIYSYLINNYKYEDYNINYNIPIKHGKEKNYNVNINAKLFMENDYNKNLITYKYKGKKEINFLIKKGDSLGKINIYYNKKLIKTEYVKLDKDIEYKPKAYLKLSSIIFIIVVLLIILISYKKLKKLIRKMKSKKKKITEPIIKKEEYVVNKPIFNVDEPVNNIDILKRTLDIDEFFSKVENIYDMNDRLKLEHDFIDRCFNNIDFTSNEELRKLYLKFNTYKNKTCNDTVNYYNKLFEYCVKRYIKDKK